MADINIKIVVNTILNNDNNLEIYVNEKLSKTIIKPDDVEIAEWIAEVKKLIGK